VTSKSAEPVVLLWGESEFLLREAAAELFGDSRPTELIGAEWTPGTTADLATPSLFGEARGLLVTLADDLADEALDEIVRYSEAPAPGSSLVLAARVSAGAKGAPPRLSRHLKGHATIRGVALARKDLLDWVLSRGKGKQIRVTPQGATALVDTLGEDPAVLDQALEQVASAFPEEGCTPETVAAQFRGLGDRRIWDLCDAAFSRDLPRALRHLTAMLDAREEPLAILGGVAARIRDLLRVTSLPSRLPPAEAAKAAGLRFDWQVRRYKQQARRFTTEELVGLHARVAEADRDLKTGAQGDVVLGRLVVGIAGEHPAAEVAAPERGA
jgi:DNA polymerase-3 subunit delta